MSEKHIIGSGYTEEKANDLIELMIGQPMKIHSMVFGEDCPKGHEKEHEAETTRCIYSWRLYNPNNPAQQADFAMDISYHRNDSTFSVKFYNYAELIEFDWNHRAEEDCRLVLKEVLKKPDIEALLNKYDVPPRNDDGGGNTPTSPPEKDPGGGKAAEAEAQPKELTEGKAIDTSK